MAKSKVSNTARGGLGDQVSALFAGQKTAKLAVQAKKDIAEEQKLQAEAKKKKKKRAR